MYRQYILKNFVKAYSTSISISVVWAVLEYIQFGELQDNRICDNVVFVLYLFALWYAFSQNYKKFK